MKLIAPKNRLNGLKITIMRSRDEVNSILEAWKELLKGEVKSVPVVDPHHYVCELQSLDKQAEPYILCLHCDDRVETMLIARRDEVSIPCRLGYLTIMKPRLRRILVYHGGLLGKQSRRACSLLLLALRNSLNDGEADVVLFDHLAADSIMYSVIRSEIHLLSLGNFPNISRHWRMEIPNYMNEFYGRLSGNSRSNLRRMMKKIDASHRVHVKAFEDRDNLEEGILAAARVSSKTYQYTLGVGFVDNPQTRSYLSYLAHWGWLRLHILYVESETAAFQLGTVYKGTYFLRQLGFDPTWRDWRVGNVLFLKVMEDLCEDASVNYLDFGHGDADYKKRYGDTYSDETNIMFFANRPYPIFVNLVRILVAGVSMATAGLVNKLGLKAKIKRLWRDRLRR